MSASSCTQVPGLPRLPDDRAEGVSVAPHYLKRAEEFGLVNEQAFVGYAGINLDIFVDRWLACLPNVFATDHGIADKRDESLARGKPPGLNRFRPAFVDFTEEYVDWRASRTFPAR